MRVISPFSLPHTSLFTMQPLIRSSTWIVNLSSGEVRSFYESSLKTAVEGPPGGLSHVVSHGLASSFSGAVSLQSMQGKFICCPEAGKILLVKCRRFSDCCSCRAKRKPARITRSRIFQWRGVSIPPISSIRSSKIHAFMAECLENTQQERRYGHIQKKFHRQIR